MTQSAGDRAVKVKTLQRCGRYSSQVETDHTIEVLRECTHERDWGQFHSPQNLAKSISIEAGELLECFQWSDSVSSERIADELADVLTYCFLLADAIGETPDILIRRKLEITRTKYPVEESRGRSTKYDQL
jgi:NTP pyrophosphatase (non-canonical NTP hydrolase)